ncbi:MAG TPA: hypothetical protein VMB26_04635, partial [Candidatus Binataceae bacterium]|nr:hypothetical protein [Candidatus Binataceae bacterium]
MGTCDCITRERLSRDSRHDEYSVGFDYEVKPLRKITPGIILFAAIVVLGQAGAPVTFAALLSSQIAGTSSPNPNAAVFGQDDWLPQSVAFGSLSIGLLTLRPTLNFQSALFREVNNGW